MRVFLEDSTCLSLFYKNKQKNISKAELSSKLSKAISFPETIILLCRLPYIEWIRYNKSERSLTYQFRNTTMINERLVDIHEHETLCEISDKIEKIFEKYF